MDAAICARLPGQLVVGKYPQRSQVVLLFAAQLQTSPSRRKNARTQHTIPFQARHAHSQSRRRVSSATLPFPAPDITARSPVSTYPVAMPPASSTRFPLSCLPLSTILRSYIITSVSSYPALLRPSLTTLAFLSRSKSPFLNPDQNPVLRALLKRTFYAQFCAGETPAEVRSTVSDLKSTGYSGVILAYAREVVLDEDSTAELSSDKDCAEQERCTREEVAAWEDGTLATVRLAERGDFVALKFTGAGREALQCLLDGRRCTEQLENAVHGICRLASERGVRLLFDAEQDSVQKGIYHWTVHFMRQYNRGGPALVYSTYQAYLKQTPEVLTAHLEMARQEGWRLGVKLVRGAYLGSDPRHLIWGTIEETHQAYNGIAEALMKRKWGGPLKGEGEMPAVDFVLASHNRESVQRARKIRDEQCKAGEPRGEMAYGQLMGMADNVSCELVQAGRERREASGSGQVDVPQPYKYLVWGSVGECVKYLLRRAQENKDAVSRTIDSRKALGQELARRMGFVR